MNKCEKHPKFTLKHPPKYDCNLCKSNYLKYGITVRQSFSRLTAIHKNKKVYQRRDKHKSPHDED